MALLRVGGAQVGEEGEVGGWVQMVGGDEVEGGGLGDTKRGLAEGGWRGKSGKGGKGEVGGGREGRTSYNLSNITVILAKYRIVSSSLPVRLTKYPFTTCVPATADTTAS